MLLQTNSYIVPKEKRAEHSRLIRRFRQTLLRLGCDHFEVYEQVGSNWSNAESAGRYVQILRFLDRKHQLAVQAAERTDPTAQAVIADFCDLINFPYQQQQGLFAVGFYTSVLPVAPKRGARGELVSTVEHEVIDDPEAEEPYPGASDGPPLEEAMGEEAVAGPVDPEMIDAEMPVVEATEQHEPVVLGDLHETNHDTFEADGAVKSSDTAPAHLEELETAGTHIEDPFIDAEEPALTTTHSQEPAYHQKQEEAPVEVESDFSNLAGVNIESGSNGHHEPNLENVFDEEDEDLAHGFELIEEPTDAAAEPAHHQAKDHPPGW